LGRLKIYRRIVYIVIVVILLLASLPVVIAHEEAREKREDMLGMVRRELSGSSDQSCCTGQG
jgi:hypothetical protein